MRRATTSSVRKASLIGFAACATIALTAWAAGASEPAETVEQARRSAERAAAAEAALSSPTSGRSAADESVAERGESARGSTYDSLGEDFEPADVSVLPDDWNEAGLDLAEARREGSRLVQTLPNGLEVEFTVDPQIQSHLEGVLEDYRVPHGGVALVEPETGRVLALVSQSRHDPPIRNIARKAAAPAASTFKIVTAAVLIESAGVNWRDEVCYHGGTSHLTESNIKGDPGRDNRCADLRDALSWSINSIFAKLAHRHLSRNDLQVWAERFGFNTEIPFELPVETSSAEIVEDPLERARTAAGFWHTYLSPLHGALIGASVENGGLLMRPSIIERVETSEGEVVHEFEPNVLRRVMSEKTADVLAKLLEGTTKKGTAREHFAGRGAFPNDVRAAGKTGTLSNKDPYLSFTWFVGFGRHLHIEERDAAVGGLICNTPKWRIKGPFAASEALETFFERREQQVAEGDESEDELAKK